MEILAAIATFIIGLACGFVIGYNAAKDKYQMNHFGVRKNAELKL